MLAVATLHLACSATELEVGRTIEQYLNALQAGDRATVARLSAAYHDEVRGLEGPAEQQVYGPRLGGAAARDGDRGPP